MLFVLPVEDLILRKEIRIAVILLLFVVLIAAFFGPFISYNGVVYEAKDVLFNDFGSVFTYLILLPFLFYFLATLFLFFDKNKVIGYLIFIFYLISAVMLFFIPYFYSSLIEVSEEKVSMGMYTIVFAVISIVLALYSSSYVFKSNPFTISDIVEIAMMIALSLVLDLAIFKFKIVPNGGSISFAMVPLFIIALRKGFIKGFISLGVVYGLIDCIIDGYGFITYPLDYLLGFGLLAIIGLFRKYIFNSQKKVTIRGCIFLFVGVLVGCALRTLSSTLSGMLLYDMGFFESMVYQLTYIGPSAILVLVVMYVLYKPLLIINVRYSTKKSATAINS
ncbi:MAG: energy-coupled thiamine transporter ThiT [Coprobacillus sp.]|nr:energy-coupled thiamine transporter ThiT [Coprobacillus sp.]